MSKKYAFKPFSPIFPDLFNQEKKRILTHLQAPSVIEHVGSTAIENLGGKGIIDIAIAVPKEDMTAQIKELEALGYEYRPTFSTPERYYFVSYKPDPEEGERRYHIHLTYPESNEWKELIGFRDYLRHHPEAVEEYAEIKQHAALESRQEGERYRALKQPMFDKIASLTQPFTDNTRYHLEHLDSIPQEYEALLFRGISEEAFHAKSLPPIQPFSIFIKDHHHNVRGGISGTYFYQSLYIDSFGLILDYDAKDGEPNSCMRQKRWEKLGAPLLLPYTQWIGRHCPFTKI